jgi:hypothetical protein
MPYTELIIFLSTQPKLTYFYIKELHKEKLKLSSLADLVTLVYCEDQPEVAKSFDVKEAPTTILLLNDSEIARTVGIQPVQRLESWVQHSLATIRQIPTK